MFEYVGIGHALNTLEACSFMGSVVCSERRNSCTMEEQFDCGSWHFSSTGHLSLLSDTVKTSGEISTHTFNLFFFFSIYSIKNKIGSNIYFGSPIMREMPYHLLE